MSTVNQLIQRLQKLVKEDPSVGKLHVYSNSPMDAEYAFLLGHPAGVYVGEVYETECNSYVEEDPERLAEEGGAKVVRAVVIDTH